MPAYASSTQNVSCYCVILMICCCFGSNWSTRHHQKYLLDAAAQHTSQWRHQRGYQRCTDRARVLNCSEGCVTACRNIRIATYDQHWTTDCRWRCLAANLEITKKNIFRTKIWASDPIRTQVDKAPNTCRWLWPTTVRNTCTSTLAAAVQMFCLPPLYCKRINENFTVFCWWHNFRYRYSQCTVMSPLV